MRWWHGIIIIISQRISQQQVETTSTTHKASERESKCEEKGRNEAVSSGLVDREERSLYLIFGLLLVIRGRVAAWSDDGKSAETYRIVTRCSIRGEKAARSASACSATSWHHQC